MQAICWWTYIIFVLERVEDPVWPNRSERTSMLVEKKIPANWKCKSNKKEKRGEAYSIQMIHIFQEAISKTLSRRGRERRKVVFDDWYLMLDAWAHAVTKEDVRFGLGARFLRDSLSGRLWHLEACRQQGPSIGTIETSGDMCPSSLSAQIRKNSMWIHWWRCAAQYCT